MSNLIDWSVLESIAPGNPQIVTHLLELFLKDADKSTGEIAQAMERADLDAVSFSAHELSGAARSLGASALADAARTLERIARAKGACEQPWQELQRTASAVTELLRARLAKN